MTKLCKNMDMKPILTILFLVMEMMLYVLILTTGGSLLVWSSYGAILLCFLFALLWVRRENILVVAGLLFTVFADYCLVVCEPIEQLWGMVFFLITQTFYAIHLHRVGKHKWVTMIRIFLIVVMEAVCILVLRDKTDPLAMISVCYYANLVMNILHAIMNRRKDRLFPVALVLFILCDTVIGLQVASGGYLPIPEGSLLHKLLFMDFNLSWLFYLPSQVLIALCVRKTHVTE